MKIDNCLMSFEDMIERLQKQGVENWPCVLLRQSIPPSVVSDDDLNEKLRNTWWEVEWSPEAKKGMPECIYLADSLPDALRRRPRITIAAASHQICTAEELLALMAPWENDEDETEIYWQD